MIGHESASRVISLYYTMPRGKSIGQLVTKAAKKETAVGGAKVEAETEVNLDVKLRLHDHGFATIGTHCIRYMSPQLRELVQEQRTDPVEFIVASFDLDDTLIKTKSGSKFARTSDDWTWWSDRIGVAMDAWMAENSKDARAIPILAIFTNQGGVTNNSPPTQPSKSFTKLMERLRQVVSSPVLQKYPLVLYASTKKSVADSKAGRGSPDSLHRLFRKPEHGMWLQLKRDIAPAAISMDRSLYVGDAAGRPKDFSDSDVTFAKSINIGFHVPEDFFT